MSDNKTYTPKLMSTLVKLDFYKSKSIMIIESTVTQEFNTCTPLLKFKFATRADAKSGGNWNDENTYWFNGYSSIFDFFSKINVLMGVDASSLTPQNSAFTFSNPAKGKGVSVRKNLSDKKEVWYLFTFFIGNKDDNNKITASLTPSEMSSIVGYLKSFMTNYPTIAMQHLSRHDYWWQNTGSKKSADGGNSTNGSGGGGGYQQNNKSSQPNRNTNNGGYDGGGVDSGLMNDINNEYGSDASGGFDDVPF